MRASEKPSAKSDTVVHATPRHPISRFWGKTGFVPVFVIGVNANDYYYDPRGTLYRLYRPNKFHRTTYQVYPPEAFRNNRLIWAEEKAAVFAALGLMGYGTTEME